MLRGIRSPRKGANHTDQGTPLGNRVTDEFFEATGMRIAQGRAFRPSDRRGEPVAIVNERLAAAGWPGRSLIIDRALRELDPALPYVDLQRLGDVLDPQIRPWRLGAIVFTALGSIAAILAAFGLYTAMAYAVAQRRREIGIRLTVGASPGTIARFILGSAFRVTLVGVVSGLLLAVAGGHWAADLLFETAPGEPLVLLTAAAGLLVIGVLASLVPARRAALVHPMEVLRLE